MEFVRVLKGYDHLWAVKSPGKGYDELTELFHHWNDAEYLLEFFERNFNDLKLYFHIERIAVAIDDTFQDADALERLILNFPYTEHLDTMFRPLGATDTGEMELSRNKARNWYRSSHASWLRIYAIRLEPDIYVVTGGTIKLTRTMREREHTRVELEKLNRCRDYLKAQGVVDKDSFVELFRDE